MKLQSGVELGSAQLHIVIAHWVQTCLLNRRTCQAYATTWLHIYGYSHAQADLCVINTRSR